MKSFLEIIAQRKYNLAEELVAINDLARRKNAYGVDLMKLFDEAFLDWPHRNNYVDFALFCDDNQLYDIEERSERGIDISVEEFIYYAEFIMNMILFADNENKTGYSKYVIDNIENVVERLNYEIHYDGSDIHIVQKDILVSEAAEIAQDTYDLGEKIYSFNYRELRGDLNAKSDILCRLYKYYETIESQAKQYGFSTLCDDVTHLSNKLDVRHTTNSRQEIVLGSMTKDEIEEWYDELFRMYLSLIVLVDYKRRRKDINELKAKLG